MLLLVFQAGTGGRGRSRVHHPVLGQRHRQHHDRGQHAADLPRRRRRVRRGPGRRGNQQQPVHDALRGRRLGCRPRLTRAPPMLVAARRVDRAVRRALLGRRHQRGRRGRRGRTRRRPAAASCSLAPPGGGYATVTASTLDGSTAAATRYQGFADVTAAVQAPAAPAPTPSPTSRPAPVRIATPAGGWWSPTTTPPSLPAT